MTIVQAISALVLMLAVWPLIRLVFIPSIRIEYRRVAIIAVAAVVLWYLLIAITVLLRPALLFPAAIIAAVLLLFERWRARARYGRSRGLPPGSLTLVPRGPWIDEKFYALQAQAHGPVFKMSQFFRPMVCFMGPAEGVDLLERHTEDLYTPAVRFSRFIPKGYIRYMESADHAVYKPLIRNALNSKVIADCADDFGRMIAECLERIATGSAATDKGLHPQAEISRLTFRCMLRLFLGIDHRSADVERLAALYEKVEIGKAASRWHAQDRHAAESGAHYIEHRAQAESGLPSCVLSELRRFAGGQAPDRTLLLNLVYMVRISASDLAGFLTWTVKLLADHPDWYRQLQAAARGDSKKAEKLAALTLREVLRLERSEYIFRKARRTFEYKGFRIPKDWILRVCIRDGHRDAGTFPDPDTFDPLRFRDRRYTKKEYSPLGIGARACAGGQTINVVGRMFLLKLTRSWSMAVRSDGLREYGRSHWQPGSKFRITLQPQ